MATKRHTSEQIIQKLRAIEVHISKGMAAEQAARQEEISEQTYYRWRKEYGRLKLEQAKRLKELEQENARLKKLLADAHLDKDILKSALEHLGNE